MKKLKIKPLYWHESQDNPFVYIAAPSRWLKFTIDQLRLDSYELKIWINEIPCVVGKYELFDIAKIRADIKYNVMIEELIQ